MCFERTGQRRNRKPRSCLLQRSHGLEHNATPGLCMDCAKPGPRNEPRRSSHHASPRTAGHMSAFDASQASLHWKQRIVSRTHQGTINLTSSLLNAHPASGSPGRQEDIVLHMCGEPECLQTAVFLGVRVGEREQWPVHRAAWWALLIAARRSTRITEATTQGKKITCMAPACNLRGMHCWTNAGQSAPEIDSAL